MMKKFYPTLTPLLTFALSHHLFFQLLFISSPFYPALLTSGHHRLSLYYKPRSRNGYIQVDPAVASAPDPICVACQYGKAHKKSHTGDKAPIAIRHDYPGAGVSADQLEAGYPGRLPTTWGTNYKMLQILQHLGRSSL